MAEPETTTQTAAAEPPKSAPPQQPTSQPKSAAQAERQAAEFGADTEIDIPVDDEGRVYETITLGELADRYRQNRNKPDIPPERLAKLEQFEKAAKGDNDAIRGLLADMVPANEPKDEASKDPTTAQLAEMQQKFDAMEARLNAVGATTEQIDALRQQQMLKAHIEQNKGQLQYLAAHPDGARIVQQRVSEAEKMASAAGRSLSQMANPAKVMAQILAGAEMEVRRQHQIYQGLQIEDLPKVQNQGGAALVNDQQAGGPAQKPGIKPPKVQVVNGQLIRDGQPVRQAGYGQLVPADDVTPNFTGESVSGQPKPPSGPMDTATLQERMRQRRDEIISGLGGGE